MLPAYHVILADDEEAVCTFVRRVIARSYPSAIVTIMNNGQDALRALEQQGTDFLITDCNMPGMDGVTLIETLRGRGSTIPILAISGYSGTEQVAIAAGATCFCVQAVPDPPAHVGARRSPIPGCLT